MSTAVDILAATSAPVCLVLGAAGKGLFDRKVKQATAVQVIASTTITLLAPLQAEVAELRQRIDKLEGENASTKGKLRRAAAYIKELLVWIAVEAPEKVPPALPQGIDD